MLPRKIILIRHGESEGNLLIKNTKNDDDSLYNEDMKYFHSALWRLTNKGVEQAKLTGKWIRNNLLYSNKINDFAISHISQSYKCFTSNYIRAMETAYNLDIPEAKWEIAPELRERIYGNLDFLYKKQNFNSLFTENLKRKQSSHFNWIPENGESMATLCERLSNFVHRTLDTGEYVDRDVIIVTHGEAIWAFKIIFGEVTIKEYEELHSISPIHNCQITEFSDIICRESYVRVFNFCPPEPDYLPFKYKQIQPKKKYTSEELLKIINSSPKMIKE